jgi:hypothetical protein
LLAKAGVDWVRRSRILAAVFGLLALFGSYWADLVTLKAGPTPAEFVDWLASHWKDNRELLLIVLLVSSVALNVGLVVSHWVQRRRKRSEVTTDRTKKLRDTLYRALSSGSVDFVPEVNPTSECPLGIRPWYVDRSAAPDKVDKVGLRVTNKGVGARFRAEVMAIWGPRIEAVDEPRDMPWPLQWVEDDHADVLEKPIGQGQTEILRFMAFDEAAAARLVGGNARHYPFAVEPWNRPVRGVFGDPKAGDLVTFRETLVFVLLRIERIDPPESFHYCLQVPWKQTPKLVVVPT